MKMIDERYDFFFEARRRIQVLPQKRKPGHNSTVWRDKIGNINPVWRDEIGNINPVWRDKMGNINILWRDEMNLSLVVP